MRFDGGMRVCVTGATGLVGGHVMARLVSDGHQVIAYVRNSDKLDRMLAAHGLASDAVDRVIGDLENATAIADALDGCDAVVHTAATVALTPDGAAAAEKANLSGTTLVLRGAAERGLDPIIHTSSVAALSPPAGPILKATDPIPANGGGYGASKAACERVARGLQDDGVPIVIFYPGGILGPVDAGSHVLGDGWVKALEPGVMPIISKGGNPYIDVRDLAAAMAACMEQGKGPRRFMAGGRYIDWKQNAELFDMATGKKWKKPPVPAWLLVALGRAGDLFGKVKKGFVPPIGHEAAIAMTTAVPTDDSAIHDELGVQYRPIEDSWVDTIRWLVQQGRMSPDDVPRFADEAPTR